MSVSYTHLDVYKRQHLAGTEASGLFEARLGAEEMPGKEVHAVSYTHLDVYKRQALSGSDHHGCLPGLRRQLYGHRQL